MNLLPQKHHNNTVSYLCVCVCVQLERFAADHNLESIGVMMQAIEQTQVNIQWVGEEKDVILKWFEREASW